MIVKYILSVVVYHFSYPKSQEKKGRDDGHSPDLASYLGHEMSLVAGVCWNCFVSLFSNHLIKFQIQILSCFYEMHQHKIFLKNRLLL